MTATPKLRPDLRIVAQTYRGEQSFIVKDPLTHKYFRFRPLEVHVMQALDGKRSAEDAAAALTEAGLPLSAAAVAGFARKLGKLGLLERSLGERSVLQLERLRSERRKRLKPSWLRGDLLRLRWALSDPDAMLERWLPRVRFCFTPPFLLFSVALFAIYFVVIGAMWPQFTATVARLGDPTLGFFIVLWGTGLTTLAIHELGHAFACKYFGGQVNEMGVMVLYFQPAFYCNVNDAWTFPERRARQWVTAAGAWIQFVIAGIAAIVWWAATPGTLVSDMAFSAVLFGGFTALVANLNPLIPLDGYFALSDWLEVPNLRQRAFAYLSWWVRAKVLRIELPEPQADDRERRIFLIYAALAAVYISLLLWLVAAWALGWAGRAFGALGVVLAAAGIALMMRSKIRSSIATLVTAAREHRLRERLKQRRTRVFAALGGALVLGLIVPRPLVVNSGFTAAPAHAFAAVARDSGVAEAVFVTEGMRVSGGAPLVRLRNRDLEREAFAAQRAVDSLTRVARGAQARGAAADLRETTAALQAAEARAAGLRERVAGLTVRARAAGAVLTPRPAELTGRAFDSGDTLLAIGETDSVEVRIAIDGPGAAGTRAGQDVALLPHSSYHRVRGTVTSVSVMGRDTSAVEVRVRLPATADLRPGVSGDARIELSESNVWGALWWNIRQRIRTDILL